MKHKLLLYLTATGALGLFAGCARIVDWGKGNFYQGQKAKKYEDTPKEFIRSVTVYSQIDTQAMFDALLLSNEVRTAYADAYALKRGKTLQQKQLFLRRQLEENHHFISFYVLTIHKIPLAQVDGPWQLLLEIDGEMYNSIEIKQVDLPEEYKSFFGKKYNRFKTAYHVKFDAKDIDEEIIIDKDTRLVELHFRSIDKHATLSWELG